MSEVRIRYESALNSIFTLPFEIGVRHLKVAFCDGSQQTLTELSKERIIYRSRELEERFSPLTKKQGIFHLITGTLEIIGYATIAIPFFGDKFPKSIFKKSSLTIFTPFIVYLIDSLSNKPRLNPQGGYSFRTHIIEGGDFYTNTNMRRKNPFHANAKEDSFYQGASWIKS